MQYQLIRSICRKTIALQVKNAQVIVRAPEFVKVEYIDKLIKLKSAWLNKKLAQQVSPASISLSPCFNNSFRFENPLYIDGVPHKVIICFGKQKVFHDEIGQSLHVFISTRYRHYELSSAITIEKVKRSIELWFKSTLLDYINHKLPLLSEKTLLHAKSFNVRKYKARWGSCNNRGELSFNYLLKMVPPWVVDYVIVHELCHLKHMNHSTNFWQLVEHHCPDFRLAKSWLKENQASLIWC